MNWNAFLYSVCTAGAVAGTAVATEASLKVIVATSAVTFFTTWKAYLMPPGNKKP